MTEKYDHEKETIKNLKNVVKGKKTESTNVEEFKFMPKEKVLLAWEAADKEHYQKTPIWYIGLFIITALGIIYGAYSGSWSTITAFILIPVAIILYGNAESRFNEIFFTEKGIYINKKFTPYKEISRFWVFNEFPIKKMGFRGTGFLQIEREILIHDVDPDLIRKALNSFIKEDEDKEESFISHLLRILKL